MRQHRRALQGTTLDPAAWTAFLRERIGLDIASRRWTMCEPAIRRAMDRVRIADADRFRAALDTDASVFEALIDEVTVGETYFFRDPRQFDFLRTRVIPDRIAVRGVASPLSIWSAGCASGEEPYSVAILCHQLGLPRPRVVGTDVSRSRLAVAERANYGKWALRGVPESVVASYFTRTGVRYQLAEHIRSAVEFRHVNLTADLPAAAPLRGADVILCRNVLIYLEPAAVRRVVLNLVDALAVDGWLLLGPSDPPLTEMADRAGCEIVITDAGLAYRRRERRMRSQAIEVAVERRNLPAAELTAEETTAPVVLPSPSHDAASASTGVTGTNAAAPPAASASAATEVTARDRWLADAAARLSARDDQAAADLARRYVDAGGGAAEGWVTLVRALGNLGHERAASLACDQGLAAHPACAELLVLRALLHLQAAQYAAAARAARRALYVDRTLIVAHLALGMAAARHGDTETATRSFSTALRALESLDDMESVVASGGEPAARLAAMARSQLDELGRRA